MKSDSKNLPYATVENATVEAMRESQEAMFQLQKIDAVGQFMRGIVHDSNNSLQSIVASLELVRKLIAAGRSGETERFIASAMTAAQRASGLNQSLLELVRRQPFDAKPLVINDVIAGMESLLRRSLPHSVKLVLFLSADLWKTCCDRSQAENVILNLILNARDAMPEGGTITIQTSNTDVGRKDNDQHTDVTPGQYVCIAVTDSGAGMSQDVIQRAFDTFFTTKTDGQGLGLGLTTVRRFSRENNGDAHIHSQIAQGTSVILHLPRYRSESNNGEDDIAQDEST